MKTIFSNHLAANATSFVLAWLAFYSLVLFSTCSAEAQLNSLPSLPWPDRKVSVSFAPDRVEIGRYRNELAQHFDSQLPTPDWKLAILRAFQKWAKVADVEFSIAEDSPRAFGVIGIPQGDPRFGDIRIAAFPQQNVLGNAVPYHPTAGTWAGDIFFDSSRNFTLDCGHASADFYDLSTIALHEAGNSLGLVDNEIDPDSVMYFAYNGVKRTPTARDVRSLQTLYGPAKGDPFEQVNRNDDPFSATQVLFPPNFSTKPFVVTQGKIQDYSDRDFFRIIVDGNNENVWIKLRTTGKSLLEGKLMVYDGELNEVARVEMQDALNSVIGKEITGLSQGEVFFVEVVASEEGDFDFGRYQLEFDFRPEAGEEFNGNSDDDDSNTVPFWEADDQSLADQLFDSFGLVDRELGQNDSFASATTLKSPVGIPENSRFEIISSLSSQLDRDHFQFTASPSSTGIGVINLTPAGSAPLLLNAVVFDRNRVALNGRRKFLADGGLQLEVTGLRPRERYFVRVLGQNANTASGNYYLGIDLATDLNTATRVQRLRLTSQTSDQYGSFTTYKTQLFRFDLSMSATDSQNQAVQFTIYSDTGRIEGVTSVRPGRNAVTYAWLNAGEHHFRFTSIARGNGAIQPSIVTLNGASISDDEGPVLIDPSGNPISGSQTPGTSPTPPPTWKFPRFLIGLILPPEFPW